MRKILLRFYYHSPLEGPLIAAYTWLQADASILAVRPIATRTD